MRSHSFQSLFSLSALLSASVAAEVVPRDDHGVLTSRPTPKLVTVWVHSTVTTCPSSPPPPPCTNTPTTTSTRTISTIITVTSKSSGGSASWSGSWPSHSSVESGSASWSASASGGSDTLTWSAPSSNEAGGSSTKTWPTYSHSGPSTAETSASSFGTWPTYSTSVSSSVEASAPSTQTWPTYSTSVSSSVEASASSTQTWPTYSPSTLSTAETSASSTNTWPTDGPSGSSSVSASETDTTTSSNWSTSTSVGSGSSISSSAPGSSYTSTSTTNSGWTTSTSATGSGSTSNTASSTSTTSTATPSSTGTTTSASASSTSTTSTTPTTTHQPPSCTDYWLGTIKHQGLAPYSGNATYKVFRNVKDYGAKGDGVTDDSDAINKAISDGGRCGPGQCTGSTTTPALVYLPPGTYLVTKPIIQYYYTQVIGNPACLPVIKAKANFLGRWVFDSNPYQASGKLGWGATNVFFRQVANIIFDLTEATNGGQEALSAIHWPSSQATSLSNIVIKLNKDKTVPQQGIFIEEGSGGFVGDIVIEGGWQGLAVGNQQFTFRNISISNSATAVRQLWSWGWTYQDIKINKCDVGFDITNDDGGVGSITVLDSEIANTPVGIKFGSTGPKAPPFPNNIMLENLKLNNVPVAVQGPSGTVLPGSSGASTIAAWGRGNAYTSSSGPNFFESAFAPNSRPGSLVAGTTYYTRSKPQYQFDRVADFLSARDAGAKGDGVADDTAALNDLLLHAAKQGKIVFLDAGYYRVTSTIYIPPGSSIVGEAYPIILSSGSFFADASNPQPVVQIGKRDGSDSTHGPIEWSNTIVSTKGAQAGAILIEYNLASAPSSPSGLWDVHVRIGGFAGSDLQLSQCAKTPGTVITADNLPKQCISGFLSFHVTKRSSGLLMENCWIWVADHDLEIGANNQQITIYAGRGLLIESATGGIWLYGTGVEHHQLYEYQLVNTKAIVMGQIQTETAYYQRNPDATIPFSAVAAYHDPVFKSGDSGWGLRIVDSKEVLIYGAGLYSFFNNYSTSCSDIGAGATCQTRIFSVEGNTQVSVYNLNTVGTTKMITVDNVDIANYADNMDGFVQTIARFRSG